MPTFTFDDVNKLIIVELPDTEVTIQQIVDAVRDWQDELINMEIENFMDASGKEALGGGVQVGITLKLTDWKIQFAARPPPNWVMCDVTGGNLVCYDTGLAQYVFPLEPSPYTNGYIARSSSATLQDLELADLRYRVESLRAHHPAFGDTVYWDPVNGNDGNNGTSTDAAVLTWVRAEELVVDEHHDMVVMCTSGETIITTPIVVTKNCLSIRGPGRHFDFKVPITEDAVTLNGENVSIEGFRVSQGKKGVVCNGTSFDVQDLSITGLTEDGIECNAVLGWVDRVDVSSCGGRGLVIKSGCRGVHMERLSARSNTGDGVRIEGGAIGTVFHDKCYLGNNGGWGMNILAGAIATIIQGSMSWGNNALGNISDAGTGTVREDIVDALEIADRVWDETSTGHTGAGKAGAQLWDQVDLIKVSTDLLPADPASQAAVDISILASEDAIRGADGDTLKTLSDESDILLGVLNDIMDQWENRLVINEATSEMWLYDDAGTTVIKKWPMTNRLGGPIALTGSGIVNRLPRTL